MMTELEKHEKFVKVQNLAIDGFICQKDEALIQAVRFIAKHLANKYADVNAKLACDFVQLDCIAHELELEVTTDEDD